MPPLKRKPATAKEPPQRRLIETGNTTDPAKLVIPPNASNYAPEPAEFTFLVDAETPNGTYLNEELLHGARPLHLGDRVRIGDSEFTFEVD